MLMSFPLVTMLRPQVAVLVIKTVLGQRVVN